MPNNTDKSKEESTTAQRQNTASPSHRAHLHPTGEKAPLVFENIDEQQVPAAQLPALQALRQLLATLSFRWRRFDMVLPPSDTLAAGVNKENLRVAADGSENLAALATGPDGQPKKLNAQQRRSLWRTGTFAVESAICPQQSHIWRVSGLLQQGYVHSREAFKNALGLCVTLLIYLCPRWLWRERGVVRGLQEMATAERNLVGLLVGAPETECPHQVDREVDLARKRFVLGPFFASMAQVPLWAPDTLTSAFATLDLRRFKQGPAILAAVRRVAEQQHEAWRTSGRQTFVRHLVRTGAARREEPSLASAEAQRDQIATACAEEYNRRFLEAVRNSTELHALEGGAALVDALVAVLQAKQIAAEVTAEGVREEAAHRELFLAELQKKRGIAVRSLAWLEWTTGRAAKRFHRALQPQLEQRLIERLKRAPGLVNEAWLAARHLEFAPQVAKLEEQIVADREPARLFRWAFRCWRKKSYTVVAKKRPWGADYTLERWRYVTVPSSIWGWRWANLAVCTASWLNNTLWGLLVPNLIAGPLGLSALLRAGAFYPDVEVNRAGKVVPDTSTRVETLVSRLLNVWDGVADARRRFEAEPDRGLLGKGIARIFNVGWNYGARGLVSTLVVVLVQPLLTLLNVMATAALCVGAFLYVPAAAAALALCNLCIFDFQHAGSGSRRLPLPAEVGRLVGLGLGQVLLGLSAALGALPLAALIVFCAALARWLLRRSYDALLFGVMWALKPRVPAGDGFLAQRISGPGLATEYFCQVAPETVLCRVQVALEQLELQAFAAQVKAQLALPVSLLENALTGLLSPLGLSAAPRSPLLVELQEEQQRLEQALEQALRDRRAQLPQLSGAGRVKLPRPLLAQTTAMAEALVRRFVQERLLPRLEGGAADWTQFFEQQGLSAVEPEDWNALTQTILRSSLGEDFLTPLEETDKSFVLQVHSVGVTDFARRLTAGLPLGDPDEAQQVTYASESAAPARSQPPMMSAVLLTCGDGLSQMVCPMANRTGKPFTWRDLYPLDFQKRSKPSHQRAATTPFARYQQSCHLDASALHERVQNFLAKTQLKTFGRYDWNMESCMNSNPDGWHEPIGLTLTRHP